MGKKNVQAQFQMLDNYVKDFSITCEKKIESKQNLNINGQLGFRVLNISENEGNLIGQIELINDIELSIGEEIKSKIHISMIGLFKGNELIVKENFENILKINGASALSHLIRAYVHAATSLSGMPPVITPMINFNEFFKNAEENKD